MLDNMLNFLNKEEKYEIDKKGVNNLRGLALDMIKNANSGHAGICLGAASIIYTLYKYHMNIDINKNDFVNRDRFILSAGHGAPLLYSIAYFLDLLHIDDLKNLRKINSKTPGHPELQTPLVECTTGLLGEGVATSIGIAIAERFLNQKTDNLLNYWTYVLCGDGELEEGITYEALSIAGNLNLNKLIVFVDSNDVQLDNNLKITSNEDIRKRFESINFNIIDANDDVESIDLAITNAKKSSKPSVIIVKTKIGLYSEFEGTNTAHGTIPSDEDILKIKEKLGLFSANWTVNQEVLESFKDEVLKRSETVINEFHENYKNNKNKKFIDKLINHDNIYQIEDLNIDYDNKNLKDLSHDILNIISDNFDLLIGGSADLSSSCKTRLDKETDFTSENYSGRNINFGIRENAMGAIINGLALSGLRPYGSTFLAFSDYMRPSIRMSAMMNLGVLYIFTHDSITVGEDGPTHQAVEQLPSLELIPNLKVYRPFDLNELIGCYIDIFKNNNPACLILPRDNKEISPNTKSNEVENGIYEVLSTEEKEYINLVSNGEELGLTMNIAKNLKEIGINSKVFSVPCLKNIELSNNELFKDKKTIAITLSKPEYFYKLTDTIFGIKEFGISGSKEEILDYYQFNEQILTSKILELLNK